MILGANALKTLEYIGLVDIVKKAGISSENCTIYSESGKPIADLSYHSQNDNLKYFFILHQDFVKTLVDYLKPGTLHYSKKLVQFRQSNTTISLIFSDGTTIDTEYLIACDGLHSLIRSQLLQSYAELSDLVYWQGLLDIEDDIRHFSQLGFSETWGPRGSFGIAPLPNNQLYWYALKNTDGTSKPYENWVTLDLLFNFFSYHEPIQTILEKTKDENMIQKQIFEFKPLQQYLFDRVLLIGDSAHSVPGKLGQGASQAIEDAMFLAMCIKSHGTLDESFKRYERLRLNRSKIVSTQMNRLQMIGQMDKPALCFIRNRLLKLIPPSVHENKLKGLFEFEVLCEETPFHYIKKHG